MRRPIVVLALLGLVLGAAGEANATLELTNLDPATGSTLSILYEGPVDYNYTSFPDVPDFESTIIQKTLTGLGPHNLLATFQNDDLDFANGFAWSERIQNNTGQAWSGFTVLLNNGVAGFGNFLVEDAFPLQAVIGALPDTLATDPTVTQISPLNGTTVTVPGVGVPGGQLMVSFDFASPVLPGSLLEIFIPIEDLPLDSSFLLTETATPVAGHAVPEPGTLFLLGAGLAGLGALGRKRWLKGADIAY